MARDDTLLPSPSQGPTRGDPPPPLRHYPCSRALAGRLAGKGGQWVIRGCLIAWIQVPLRAVSLTQRLKNKARRFLERPGSTVDLRPLEELLPRIEARGEEVAELGDAELTEAAGLADDFVEICALGREAAWRGLEQRPYDVQLLGVMSLLAGKVAEMATG